MKVDPRLLRQRLRHIRNELNVLELRRSNIVAMGTAVKPSAMRKVQRRMSVLHAEEDAIRQSLGEWQSGVTYIKHRAVKPVSVSWRAKGFAYGNEGRTSGTPGHRSE